jgi:4-methyl-5(b-hydroxyethyl)-thiazole monophosphate biosynthesis
MAKRLLVVLYPGVADWEVTFPIFCLRPGIKHVFGSTGPERIKTAMGFEIDVDPAGPGSVGVSGFDGIFLPGGIDPATDHFPRSLGEDPDLLDLLRKFAEENRVVAAICGAPLVLGAAGLLKGKSFASDVTDDTRGWFDGATRSEEALCIHGKLLTASVSATIPFAAELARLLGDEKTAGEIEAFFVR